MTSEAWDAHSKEYAAMPSSGPMSLPCQRLLSALDAASPFSSATVILDVGSGPGTSISLLISEYGSQIPSSTCIIASDYSTGMINCVCEKKEKMTGTGGDVGGCWSRLEAKVMDAMELKDIEDGEVSHVMGNMVYFMLPNPFAGLVAAHRILAPGGAFALTSMSKADWLDLLQLAAHRVRPDLPSTLNFSISEAWTSTEGLKLEFEKAGFTDVKTEYVDIELPMHNAEMFVTGFIKGNNPGAKMIVGNLNEEELGSAAEEWISLVGERGNVVKGRWVVASGRK